jgi:hypothetical protein
MSNRVAVAWLALALFVGADRRVRAGARQRRRLRIAFSADETPPSRPSSGTIIADIRAGSHRAHGLQGRLRHRRGTQTAFVIPLLVIAAVGGGFLLLTARRTEAQNSRATYVSVTTSR